MEAYTLYIEPVKLPKEEAGGSQHRALPIASEVIRDWFLLTSALQRSHSLWLLHSFEFLCQALETDQFCDRCDSSSVSIL